MSPRACSGALARCTGMARRRGQRTLRGNINVYRARARATFLRTRARAGLRALQVLRCSAAQHEGTPCRQRPPSQRSLHNAPIFRLLLKVAVNGTHQCDFLQFLRDPRVPIRCSGIWLADRGPALQRLAWPLRKDDTHKSRSVNNFFARSIAWKYRVLRY